jgi:hypothetical protein
MCLALMSGVTAGVPALVAPASADSAADTTIANVEVTSSITVSNLTTAFTLTGTSGDTPTTGANPVTMTVTTNNFAGYNVTVEATTAALAGAPGNNDAIPSNLLEVDGPEQGGTYAHLTFGTPLVVATKGSASSPDGDSIVNNYRMTVPFVRPDTYSGTLDYVATTP